MKLTVFSSGLRVLVHNVNVLFVAIIVLVMSGCETKQPLGGGLAIEQRHTAAAPTNEPVYRNGAVAADHPIASLAGLEMLRKGGNAVDAAVATSFCLSVVRPYSCGIGGGGFMVIHLPETREQPAHQIALNYRETAPAMVGPSHYVNLGDPDASKYGHHAAGVPGTVAGLLYALDRWGTLDRQTVLAPAIRAAEQGFFADANFVSAIRSLIQSLVEHPELTDHAWYLVEQLGATGELAVGDLITNPEQARALRLIAQQGADVFYRGEIAHAIAQTMSDNNGSIAFTDLARYRPRVVDPLLGSFGEYDVISMPPPSSGGVAMQQILGLLERKLAALDDLSAGDDADYVHLLTEAMKHAFADRAEWLADSAFVEVPIDRLTGRTYLNELARRIDMNATGATYDYGSVTPAPDDSGTSHLSVIDKHGMAVACTETINTGFGSMVVVPGFGFALNNEMDDFTTVPGQPNAYGLRQSDRNLPLPGKRPLSSMSPTIVLKDGKAVLIAGASGGPRIITGTLQCLLNCLLFDMSPKQAVSEPRFHHQWLPDALQFERQWTEDDVIDAMAQRGHATGQRADVGVVQLIRISRDGIRAASDPRKGGQPAGY